jgi:hypothetical protein
MWANQDNDDIPELDCGLICLSNHEDSRTRCQAERYDARQVTQAVGSN